MLEKISCTPCSYRSYTFKYEEMSVRTFQHLNVNILLTF